MALEDGGGPLVALAIGVASALATIAVAMINGRHSRRDTRDNLKRDIELSKQLRDGTTAKNTLEGFIAQQIDRMAIEAFTRTNRIALLIAFAVTQTGLVTTLIRSLLKDNSTNFDTVLLVGSVCSAGVFILLGISLESTRAVWRKRFPNEDIPQVQPRRAKNLRLRNALRIDNIRAAWTALRTDPPQSRTD